MLLVLNRAATFFYNNLTECYEVKLKLNRVIAILLIVSVIREAPNTAMGSSLQVMLKSNYTTQQN